MVVHNAGREVGGICRLHRVFDRGRELLRQDFSSKAIAEMACSGFSLSVVFCCALSGRVVPLAIFCNVLVMLCHSSVRGCACWQLLGSVLADSVNRACVKGWSHFGCPGVTAPGG